MKKFIFILFLILDSSFIFGQARVVINNNGYIIIDNSGYVVLQNSNANALATAGTGGNILSENETDVIKWKIGNTTGTYTIPWTTASGTKIPLTITKTTGGTGATAEFILSTYETGTDMNVPWPSTVTNMNNNFVDKSLYVIDRYWHIDALSYTAKPDITLSIAYDDAANEMAGTNTITEANLQAQRFNTSLGQWEAYKLFGTTNTATNVVSGITVPAADFFEDWILVDISNPLPITLTSFEADCENNEVIIKWVTQTEINNDYFVVEKSYDALTYFDLISVQGAGNISTPQYYAAVAGNTTNASVYYRLKQVDFDGTTTYHDVVTTNCNIEGFDVAQLSLNDGKLKFNVENNMDEDLNVCVYDARGRIILHKPIKSKEGTTFVNIDNLKLSTGIYMLSIIGEFNKYSTKLMNH